MNDMLLNLFIIIIIIIIFIFFFAISPYFGINDLLIKRYYSLLILEYTS
ncbi:hypothetical protein ACMBCM_09020 [Spiroplasma sp. K1]